MFSSSPRHLVSAWLPPVADPAARRAASRRPPGRRPPAEQPSDCWSTDNLDSIAYNILIHQETGIYQIYIYLRHKNHYLYGPLYGIPLLVKRLI